MLHFHFTPTTPSCTQESNTARLTLRSEEQSGCFTETERERERGEADRTELWVTSSTLSVERSADVVREIDSKAADRKCVRSSR